jgi:hypothetical protein
MLLRSFNTSLREEWPRLQIGPHWWFTPTDEQINLRCQEPLGLGCLAGLRVFALATGLVFATDIALPRDLYPGHDGGGSTRASVVFRRQRARLFGRV